MKEKEKGEKKMALWILHVFFMSTPFGNLNSGKKVAMSANNFSKHSFPFEDWQITA